jgi:SAM-dependent methyltransferase
MPTKQQCAADWVAGAANWIARIRGPGDPSRAGLLDDWMLDAVGEVRDLDVIDLGCGEGTFCRMLARRGARILGVDLCEPMVDAARKAAASPRERYAVGDMEQLADVADARFDLAVSYITLVDVHDLRAAIREAYWVLRPGGRFVACNLAPMVTAGNTWVKDGDGTKLHFRLDNYPDEGPRETVMCGSRFTNFHRTLSSYVNAFLEGGFVLEGIREPVPNPEQLARVPANDDMLRVPLFIIYLLRKPPLPAR